MLTILIAIIFLLPLHLWEVFVPSFYYFISPIIVGFFANAKGCCSKFKSL